MCDREKENEEGKKEGEHQRMTRSRLGERQESEQHGRRSLRNEANKKGRKAGKEGRNQGGMKEGRGEEVLETWNRGQHEKGAKRGGRKRLRERRLA